MRLNQIEFDAIYNSVEAADVNIAEMSIGDVLGFMVDSDRLAEYAESHATDTVERVRLCKGIIKAIERLVEVVKSWDTEPTQEERQAAKGVNFPTLIESVLLDTVEFYSLHSTADAERLPLSDWMIVKKAKSAERKFQRNYDIILNKKFESKK